MNWFRRLRVVTKKEDTDRELEDELQFHLDNQIQENISAGMSPDEARRAAIRDFGIVAGIKDECRSARGLDWLEDLWQDLRFAVRSYRRNPGFAIAVIALTAVGIGATTAVFSVVDRVLFREPPYARPGQLVSLGMRIPWLEYDFLTTTSYRELKRDPAPLAAVTSWSGIGDCDLTGTQPVRLACAQVEASFLPLLGVVPALGRNFTKDEDQPGVPRVALISHTLWKNRLGGDSNAVGRRIRVDGEPVLIVGVLPRDFEFPTLERADLLVPQALPPNLPPGPRPLRIYGRLRDGVSVTQVYNTIMASAESLFTDFPPHVRKHVQFRVRKLHDVQTGDFRLASWTLLAAVVAMLSIACANAANLLLARSAARRHELAVRVALGAGHARMVRQTLTETLLLGAAGGIAGCVLAYALLRVFVLIAPAGIPHLASASLDVRVLVFATAASLACGAAFGLAPAVHMPKTATLARTRGNTSVSLLTRRLLVGAQLAVSLVLMTCAGALLQSLWNRQAVPLGMNTEGVATAQVVLGARYAQPAARAAFYEQLEQRLGKLPGIESVALSDSLPPGGVPRSQPIFALSVDGKPPLEQNTPGIVVWRSVTPGYFRTLGIPILRGRAFTEDDRHASARSIVISASYARRLFGGEDPLGRRISRFRGDVWHTIIGVSADARNSGLTDHNDPEYYLVRRHGATEVQDVPAASSIIVRAGDGAALATWLRTEIAALDPALPATISSLDAHVGELAARPRFQAWLLVLFAGLGLVLAVFGVYGLMSFLATEREHEIGVRLTLGATPARIVVMILGDAFRWTTGGVAVGLAAAVAVAWWLRSLLFHVSPTDPAAYVAAVVLLSAPALLAAFLPSRRAARLDPSITLRRE